MKRTEENLGETGYRLEVSEKMLVSVLSGNEGSYLELQKSLILFLDAFIQIFESRYIKRNKKPIHFEKSSLQVLMRRTW